MPAARTPLSRQRPGILVIDDEPKVRTFLRTALQRTGRVLEAADGDRAVEIIRAHAGRDLDLILTDYKLPGRSGLEVLQEAKQRCPWVPVVLLTGFGSEELAVQAFRDGVSDYLAKPVRLDALIRTVDALVPQRRAGWPPPRRTDKAGVVDHRIRRALTFLQAHFSEPVTLARVAAATGLSRFHFCRLFHRDTGRRLHAYVHELRIARAKALLGSDQRSVTQVAYTVGFKDVSHFDKAFRRVVGRSPTEYRASLQKKESPKARRLSAGRRRASRVLARRSRTRRAAV